MKGISGRKRNVELNVDCGAVMWLSKGLFLSPDEYRRPGFLWLGILVI